MSTWTKLEDKPSTTWAKWEDKPSTTWAHEARGGGQALWSSFTKPWLLALPWQYTGTIWANETKN